MDRSTAAANTTFSATSNGSRAAQALGQLLGRRPPVLLDLRTSSRRDYHVEVVVSAALTIAGLVFGFLLLISALQPATAQDLRAPLLVSGSLAGVLLAVYLAWRHCRPQPGTGFQDTLESREIDIVRGVFRIHVYDRQTLQRHSRCEIGFDRLVALCEVDQRPRLLPWPRRPMARLTLVERGTGLGGPGRAPLWAIHSAPAVRATPRRKGAASAWDTARTAWVPPAEMHEVIQVFAACTGLHVRHAAIEPDTTSSSETLSISH